MTNSTTNWRPSPLSNFFCLNLKENLITALPLGDSLSLILEDIPDNYPILNILGINTKTISKLVTNPVSWLQSQSQLPSWLSKLILILGGENISLLLKDPKTDLKTQYYFDYSQYFDPAIYPTLILAPASVHGWPEATNQIMLTEYFGDRVHCFKSTFTKNNPTQITLESPAKLRIVSPGLVTASDLRLLIPKKIKVIDYQPQSSLNITQSSNKVVLGTQEALIKAFGSSDSSISNQTPVSLGGQSNLQALSNRINDIVFKAKKQYPETILSYLPMTKQGKWQQIINYKLSKFATVYNLK